MGWVCGWVMVMVEVAGWGGAGRARTIRGSVGVGAQDRMAWCLAHVGTGRSSGEGLVVSNGASAPPLIPDIIGGLSNPKHGSW